MDFFIFKNNHTSLIFANKFKYKYYKESNIIFLAFEKIFLIKIKLNLNVYWLILKLIKYYAFSYFDVKIICQKAF